MEALADELDDDGIFEPELDQINGAESVKSTNGYEKFNKDLLHVERLDHCRLNAIAIMQDWRLPLFEWLI